MQPVNMGFRLRPGCRGRTRDLNASVPSRRASEFSNLRSLKEGRRNHVPPQGESGGVMLPQKDGSCSPLAWVSGCGQGVPWKDSGFSCLRSLEEGFGIREPPFP